MQIKCYADQELMIIGFHFLEAEISFTKFSMAYASNLRPSVKIWVCQDTTRAEMVKFIVGVDHYSRNCQM